MGKQLPLEGVDKFYRRGALLCKTRNLARLGRIFHYENKPIQIY